VEDLIDTSSKGKSQAFLERAARGKAKNARSQVTGAAPNTSGRGLVAADARIRDMNRVRLRTLSFLVATGLWLAPGLALADPMALKLATSVPLGQQPRLIVTANQPLDKVEVALGRDDGKSVEESFGPLEAGASRDVLFDGKAGKRHYRGRVTCAAGQRTWTSEVSFDTIVAGILRVTLDKSHVDLARGRLDLVASVPDGKIQLGIVSATDGKMLVEREQPFADHDTSAPLIVTWDPPGKDAEIGRIEVRVTDPSGAYHLTTLVPWSVFIPHKEVAFANDSSAIAPGEVPKLEASLAKITEALAKYRAVGPIRLFVVGHTDTVGSAKYNLGLSLRRGQAIAAWFRTGAPDLPIAYEGFGEQALSVPTPDNTSEPRNRRVDYILSVEDPVLPASDFQPTWKTLPSQ
jgi:outer membrane protein OmpA-like peptidoglycan-associated protein